MCNLLLLLLSHRWLFDKNCRAISPCREKVAGGRMRVETLVGAISKNSRDEIATVQVEGVDVGNLEAVAVHIYQ